MVEDEGERETHVTTDHITLISLPAALIGDATNPGHNYPHEMMWNSLSWGKPCRVIKSFACGESF